MTDIRVSRAISMVLFALFTVASILIANHVWNVAGFAMMISNTANFIAQQLLLGKKRGT